MSAYNDESCTAEKAMHAGSEGNGDLESQEARGPEVIGTETRTPPAQTVNSFITNSNELKPVKSRDKIAAGNIKEGPNAELSPIFHTTMPRSPHKPHHGIEDKSGYIKSDDDDDDAKSLLEEILEKSQCIEARVSDASLLLPSKKEEKEDTGSNAKGPLIHLSDQTRGDTNDYSLLNASVSEEEEVVFFGPQSEEERRQKMLLQSRSIPAKDNSPFIGRQPVQMSPFVKRLLGDRSVIISPLTSGIGRKASDRKSLLTQLESIKDTESLEVKEPEKEPNKEQEKEKQQEEKLEKKEEENLEKREEKKAEKTEEKAEKEAEKKEEKEEERGVNLRKRKPSTPAAKPNPKRKAKQVSSRLRQPTVIRRPATETRKTFKSRIPVLKK